MEKKGNGLDKKTKNNVFNSITIPKYFFFLLKLLHVNIDDKSQNKLHVLEESNYTDRFLL